MNGVSMQEQDIPSSNLSDYIVEIPLGRGAYSFVYRIKSRKCQKCYALKVIEKTQQNSERRQKLLQEINIQKQINHPNIVKVYNWFEDTDNFYIQLELCEEGELFTYLKSKKGGNGITEEEIQQKGRQIALALQHLHSRNIIHRDLKLANVLVTKGLDLKISDFGLAVQLNDADEERLTLCGTPNYISPEIVKKESYTMKSDIWALGCILYAMATGHPPFECDSVQATLQKIRKSNLSLPQSMSLCFQDLLSKIICWDHHKRLDVNQVLQHPFFNSVLNKQGNNGGNNSQAQNQTVNRVPFREISVIDNGNNFLNKRHNVMQDQIICKQPNIKETKALSMQQKQQLNKYNLQSQNNSTNSNLQIQKCPTSRSQSSNYFTSRQEYTQAQNTNNENNKQLQLNKYNDRRDINMGNCFKKKNINIQQINTIKSKNQQQTRTKSSLQSRNPVTNEQTLNKCDINDSTCHTINTTFQTSASTLLQEVDISTANLSIQASCQYPIPLSTAGLKDITCQTQHGQISIFGAKHKYVQFRPKNQSYVITCNYDGQKIILEQTNLANTEQQNTSQKLYTLQDLPKKCVSIYNYMRKVCDLLLVKTPLARISNDTGKFKLFEGFEGTKCFEATFQNKILINGKYVYCKVTHKVGTDTMTITSITSTLSDSNVVSNTIQMHGNNEKNKEEFTLDVSIREKENLQEGLNKIVSYSQQIIQQLLLKQRNNNKQQQITYFS